MPAKTVKNIKSATKRTPQRRSRTRRSPSHAEISERAYFIYLERRDSGELENWLRAEQELTAA
jgi:Protein of unknown function (DUF2934)